MSTNESAVRRPFATARGMNKCAWCGKMAQWSDLHYHFDPEKCDGYYEHKGECPKRAKP